MQLGTRRIRSAGQTSGSIEVTLPPVLHALAGLACRIVVRDGVQPEIVLQPDLAGASRRVVALWDKLAAVLAPSEAIDGFTPGMFVMTLLPLRHGQGGAGQSRPALAYADLLALAPGDGEADPAALARILGALAAAMVRDLGLNAMFAAGFGNALAYLVAGVSAGLASEFERSVAVGLSGLPQRSPLPGEMPAVLFEDDFWLDREAAFRRLFNQFVSWQDDPDGYEAARRRWYRALRLENAPTAFAAGPALAGSRGPACQR